jgi:hypothetical protein
MKEDNAKLLQQLSQMKTELAKERQKQIENATSSKPPPSRNDNPPHPLTSQPSSNAPVDEVRYTRDPSERRSERKARDLRATDEAKLSNFLCNDKVRRRSEDERNGTDRTYLRVCLASEREKKREKSERSESDDDAKLSNFPCNDKVRRRSEDERNGTDRTYLVARLIRFRLNVSWKRECVWTIAVDFRAERAQRLVCPENRDASRFSV